MMRDLRQDTPFAGVLNNKERVDVLLAVYGADSDEGP